MLVRRVGSIARVVASSAFVLLTYRWLVLTYINHDPQWAAGVNPRLAGVTVVSTDIGIEGTVTGYNSARGFKIYLNSSDTPYNFDAFVNERLAPHDSLGYYLAPGDSISKQPNSPVLRLTRGGQTSEWRWVVPASR